MLTILNPRQIEVEIWREDDLARHRGLSSELDEMWSYVRRKSNPRWLWHAIDHHTGKVLADVFGRRKDTVFLKLKALLEPFGIRRYYTDGWGTDERHVGLCRKFWCVDELGESAQVVRVIRRLERRTF
jgi:insertion element IS1 protein InsB